MTPSNDVATRATRNSSPATATPPATITPPPTATPPAATPVGVGIDVAKDKLDLARTDAPGRCLTVPNDPAGIAQVLAALAAAPPASAIVVESTGGLERPLLNALLDARLPAALVNPGKIRHFAIGLGILAKTDAVDAAVLARFALLANHRLAERRTANAAELDALVTCRRQLIASRTAHRNRRGATASKAAGKALDAVLRALDKQVDALDRQIAKLIESDDDLGHKAELLRSAPGVGPTLAATLVAELRELGTTDHRRISALVGVAPFANDSGQKHGKRSIRGGRADVRCALYMATLAAARFNPVIKALSDQLKAAGKQPKVVIVACMRKLLVFLNAMLRDNLRWDQLKAVTNASKTA